MRAPSQTTLQHGAEEWLAAAAAEVIRTRSGDPYKPSALRAYKQALQHRVLPALGPCKLTQIRSAAEFVHPTRPAIYLPDEPDTVLTIGGIDDDGRSNKAPPAGCPRAAQGVMVFGPPPAPCGRSAKSDIKPSPTGPALTGGGALSSNLVGD